GFPIKRWVDLLIPGREEESTESLQVIALQRAICTSDDPATLLNATANIFSIKDVDRMEKLWTGPNFQERFEDQLRSSYSRMLQLRGPDQVNIATASQRLYSAAAVHIMLYWSDSSDSIDLFLRLIPLERRSFLIPDSQVPGSSTCLIRGTLALTIIQAWNTLSPETVAAFRNFVFTCSLNWESQDWRLFCVLSLINSNLSDWQSIFMDSLQKAYRGS
ncbi:hypothetical protein FS837_004560, partial [Tulasnella sp. UAMH 9824]